MVSRVHLCDSRRAFTAVLAQLPAYSPPRPARLLYLPPSEGISRLLALPQSETQKPRILHHVPIAATRGHRRYKQQEAQALFQLRYLQT
jgi:hypothetical protein